MDTINKLKQFDAYPKTLEDFRIKTCGGATGEWFWLRGLMCLQVQPATESGTPFILYYPPPPQLLAFSYRELNSVGLTSILNQSWGMECIRYTTFDVQNIDI